MSASATLTTVLSRNVRNRTAQSVARAGHASRCRRPTAPLMPRVRAAQARRQTDGLVPSRLNSAQKLLSLTFHVPPTRTAVPVWFFSAG